MDLDENMRKKLEKTLDVLAWHFNEKREPTGFYSTIGRIDEKLGILNERIEKANESSGKLSKALNKITLAGVVIAGIGIIIAIANLALEVIKIIW